MAKGLKCFLPSKNTIWPLFLIVLPLVLFNILRTTDLLRLAASSSNDKHKDSGIKLKNVRIKMNGEDQEQQQESSTTFTASHHDDDDDAPDVVLHHHAVNSASGSTFRNEKMRTWLSTTHPGGATNNSTTAAKTPTSKKKKKNISTMTKHCNRWGVVTTIFDPNEAITRVVNMPSWCLVIVPDSKTPNDYMAKLKKLMLVQKHTNTSLTEKIFYFSIEKQKEWEKVDGPFGTFVRLTPWNHFCRKNLGYLFAILHGAQYIFDFDDDNFIKLDEDGDPFQILPDGDDPYTMILKDVDIIMQGANVFNHHPIMGASLDDSWARGFPLDMIQNKNTRGQVAFTEEDLKFRSHDKEIGVIQFLADGNPDVDALHRLSKPLPMTFPLKGAHSVLVPVHAYSPYNAQATIHTQNAMWAMLLPGTVPGRVSDIWRSYFAQCIFADAGLRVVFSPPKIEQKRNEHEYLGDFHAESDLYTKSGKLVEFLSQWDSSEDSDTIPKRMEELWIDLYEYGYIEKDDVYTVQAWLGALEQVGYNFPQLRRRYRNIAVLGQFNYANSPTVVNDVIFWTQKNKESFDTVIAAGPFNKKQMNALKENFIDAISNQKENLSKEGMLPGFFTPLENLKDTLLRFKNSKKIEGVMYAHDDGIMNITELSEGRSYPFPSKNFIGTGQNYLDSLNLYSTTKLEKEMKHHLKKSTYRIFPDGHLEDFFKKQSYSSFHDLHTGIRLDSWDHYDQQYCSGGQIELAKDADSSRYREKDGSILFLSRGQADFFFVPTEYAEEFAIAADLHLKHGIFIECAFNTILNMVRMKTNATVRSVDLCTDWNYNVTRGTVSFLSKCLNQSRVKAYGFLHPFKIGMHGYKTYSHYYDEVQVLW